MHSEHSSDCDSSEQLLRQRLKNEALAERPPFSEDLHARMMNAIEAPGSAGVEVGPPNMRRSRRTVALWIAIAASLLIAVASIAQLRNVGDKSRPIGPPPNGPAGLAAGAEARVNISLDDLNHDATLAFRLVVDQLPIEVPADDWGLPAVN